MSIPRAGRARRAARPGQATVGGSAVGWFLVALFLVPIGWTALYSLRSSMDSLAFPVRFWPEEIQWDNYVRAVTMIDLPRYLVNSLLLSATYTLLITMSSSLVGFAFARLPARGRAPLFVIVLSTLMVPPIITIIPTYVLFARLGLIGNYWPWVLWGIAGSPVLIFLFRQFYAAVPLELEEAALIDGASYLRMYVSIFLPLAKPVVATSTVLAFVWVWGDFFTPALFLDADKTTMAVAMVQGYVDDQTRTLPHVLAAGVVYYVAPVILVFVVAQRRLVQGVMSSGVKG